MISHIVFWEVTPGVLTADPGPGKVTGKAGVESSYPAVPQL